MVQVLFEELKAQLEKCRNSLAIGYAGTRDSGINWLNKFCGECLHFVSGLHKYVGINKAIELRSNEHLDSIYLCLTQVCICAKYMEQTIKAENVERAAMLGLRQHFLDRFHWCLERMFVSLVRLATLPAKVCILENYNYLELLDVVLDQIRPYSDYKGQVAHIIIRGTQESVQAIFMSGQIRSAVNFIVTHVLGFANVALKDDKTALSVLCQKVLRECIAFQEECAIHHEQEEFSDCNRKLKAMTLEHALCQLDSYLNEALLRLVFHCFLDFEKFSIQRIRTLMRMFSSNNTDVDEVVADFDINLDRALQVGLLAIAYAPNFKVKTLIRSCLASLESLDSCIIPSLHTKNVADIYSAVLEDHYNEEIMKFKNIVQEIVESRAFVACYYELLVEGINRANANFNIHRLQEMVAMGEFLVEHFDLPVNRKVLVTPTEPFKRRELFDNFTLMLRECHAILVCASQVDAHRILKRFKILRSTLRKFLNTFTESFNNPPQINNDFEAVFISPPENAEECIFDTLGISPSASSILYPNLGAVRRLTTNKSLRVNYTAVPAAHCSMAPELTECTENATGLEDGAMCSEMTKAELEELEEQEEQLACDIERRQNMRRSVFKLRTTLEDEEICTLHQTHLESLEISEILGKITALSSRYPSDSEPDAESNSE